MRYFALLIGLAIVISGCSSVVYQKKELYQAYNDYRTETNRDNVIALAPKFFTPKLLGSDYASKAYTVDFLLFKDSISDETSHFEKRMAGGGCLTINGLNNDELVIINLGYKHINQHWLIDRIHLVYDENKPADQAFCPGEFSY